MDAVEILDDEKPKKGFANPEILAKARAARAAKKENDDAEVKSDEVETPVSFSGSEIEEPKKKRGRPPGSSNSVGKTKRDIKGLSSLLVSIHMMVASATGYLDLAIDEAEGNTLAEALANVAELHKFKMDAKTSAYLGLIYAIGIVYGPRAISIIKQKRNNDAQSTA